MARAGTGWSRGEMRTDYEQFGVEWSRAEPSGEVHQETVQGELCRLNNEDTSQWIVIDCE